MSGTMMGITTSRVDTMMYYTISSTMSTMYTSTTEGVYHAHTACVSPPLIA